MFLNFLKRSRNSQRTSPMPSVRRTEIDRIKADADAALTRFNGETTQFCLRRINREVKT